MKKLLVINSSARTLSSQSRKLTETFIRQWEKVQGDSFITFRELGTTHVPHINESWIAAAFKPEIARSEEDFGALEVSNSYISELRDADVIVIGAPMYNWSIPSALKAYIDQILRVNETFKVNGDRTDKHYIGLLENKTLFLLLSRGDDGYEKGEHNEHLNYQSNYLKMVFNIIGITNIRVITISGGNSDSDKFKKSMESAHQSIRELID